MRAVELVLLPLVIVRPCTVTLSRTARPPAPFAFTVPRFDIVALLPLTVMADPEPTVRDPEAVRVPVSALAGPRVCAVVEVELRVKSVADAVPAPSARVAAASVESFCMESLFIFWHRAAVSRATPPHTFRL